MISAHFRKSREGFTLVELVAAIAIFSFLLLIVTYGFIQINRSYTRGITTKTIQETTRAAIEDIARNIRFTDNISAITQTVNGHFYIQIGETCYAWNQHTATGPDAQLDPTRSSGTFIDTTEEITLVKGGLGVCTETVISTDSELVLDERAVVQFLDISSIGGGAFQIRLVISTEDANDNDLRTYGYLAECEVQIGDQFCDVAKYETAVFVRN